MKECPVLTAKKLASLRRIATSLNYCDKTFAAESVGENHYCLSKQERLRLMVLSDAIIAKLYGLNEEDYRFVLENCDHPVEKLSNKIFTSSLNPKGFWRVDREVEPELRQTVLSLVAFMELEKAIAAERGNIQSGIEAFLKLNDGEGWMLPEMLCLADYGLGHDERAKVPQPVASRLGPRFYDWQLMQSAEDFKRECAVHAANLGLGIVSLPEDEGDTSRELSDTDFEKASHSQLEFDF